MLVLFTRLRDAVVYKRVGTFILTLAFVVSAFTVNAQNDPVVFEINGKKIYKSEFMRDFLRSIGKDPKAAPTACTYEKRQALEEYVQLFVNYRTKLEDAFANGFDTLPSMLKELGGYRKELAAPYLIDSATLDRIMEEAYERNHYVLSAAHIYVPIRFNPQPEDTLKAYNQVMEYYLRVLNNEDFFDIAREQAAVVAKAQGLEPDDPRAKDDGRLGNFTVFDMVYPFESAAYGLNVGEVSKPVRTSFGYHIIKLLNKVPYFGKSTFQHIWIAEKADNPESSKHLINDAYKQLQNDVPFQTVCRNYSDDNSTSQNGGLLSDMSIRQIPQEYVTVLSSLKRGETSKPFHSRHGWHIVKLLDRDSLASFEDMLPSYRQRLTRDSRNNKPREAFIEQCKARYNFKDYTTMYETVKKGKKSVQGAALASLDNCRSAINDSVFTKSWHFDMSKVTDMRPLFSVGEKSYNTVDLLKFIEAHQRAEAKKNYDLYIEDRYHNFINDKVFEYAEQHLESDHPEFGDLMTEYRNGLMIFAYNDANVWSKAISDSAGLAKYYAENVVNHSIDNESDASYFMGECVEMGIFTFSDSSWLKPGKALKIVQNGDKSGSSDAEIRSKLEKALKIDSVNVIYEASTQEVDKQSILAKNQLRKGVYIFPYGNGYRIVRVAGLLNPRPKTLREARGFYINDYQNYLEKQLIDNLRKKYNVIIHQDVIDEITY